jgi:hypothetical protein
MEGEFNIFWYENGTGSHEKGHNSLIYNWLAEKEGLFIPFMIPEGEGLN